MRMRMLFRPTSTEINFSLVVHVENHYRSIHRQPRAAGWDNPACRKRAMFGPQREPDAIFLRYPPRSSHTPWLTEKGPIDTYYSLHGFDVIDAEETSLFPETVRCLGETAGRLLGHLQRAVILGLRPRSDVHKHIDLGSHYVCRDRLWPKLAIDQGRKGVEVQREVDTAFLRVASAVPGAHPVYAALHGQDAEDHPNSLLVPEVMKFLRDFCAETDATLARALLAKLPPGKSVGWHIDRGSYYQATARYHLAILNEGATFRAETTTYEQHTGELWSFDNTKPHGAFNNTAVDRSHLIFDTQPARLKAHAEMLKEKYSTAFYKADPNRG